MWALAASGGVIILNPVSGGASALTHIRIDAFHGDGTWTSPSSSGNALVEAWGAGGSGVADTGAGGGAEYCRVDSFAFSASTGYAVVVGNSDGENSTFNSTTVIAVGGDNGTEGAAGGTGGTGDTCFAGGAGATGTGDQAGGGGGGTTEAGGNASGTTPGDAGDYFGGAGAHVTTFAPGYGSGGKSRASAFSPGANGHVRITYDIELAVGFPAITGRNWGRSAQGTSHAVNLPTCPSGDLLIALFAIDGAPTLSGYTGWTSIAEDANGTQVKGLALYKTSTGSDTLTITSDASQMSTHLSVCVDGASGNPDATATNGSSTNADPPSHTHGGGSTKALWIAAAMLDGRMAGHGPDVGGFMANYADFLWLSPATLDGAETTMATRHLEAETENPGAFASSNDQWVAITIAVPGG